jgi:hypothetical protein
MTGSGGGLRTFSARAVLLAVIACAPSQQNADTSSVLRIDTVKPATSAMQGGTIDTTPPPDSTPIPATKTKAKTTSTKTAAKQPETKELGRDSIIRRNPRDPRFQLPAVDTTKKP